MQRPLPLATGGQSDGILSHTGETVSPATGAALGLVPPILRVNRQAERMLADYGNSILRLAYSYLHNLSDAEEVLQDTLIQFLKTTPALDGSKHEKAWLLRVEDLIAEERKDLSFVWEAVKALPVNQREAIHLFYHEGFTTAEIAAMLGRRESTVRSDLRRGRTKLKEILKEAYDFGKGV